MADTKISELPAATSVDSPDLVPIVQGGETKRAAVGLFQSFLKFIGLDFTGNNLTFMNGTTMWKSTGNSNSTQSSGTLTIGQEYLIKTYHSPDDFTNVGASSNANGILFTATGTTPSVWSSSTVIYTRPYTPITAGIIVKDANDVEVWRLFASDPGSGNEDRGLYIGAGAGANAIQHSSGGQDSTAVGFGALGSVTTGQDNTGLGTFAGGAGLVTGSANVFIGSNVGTGASDISNSVAIGAGIVITGSNAIALNAFADDDNTAVIGNDALTDAYFGSTSGNAILHGKGDAIVFPDSDPHVAGAAYWVLGVLTRSAG